MVLVMVDKNKHMEETAVTDASSDAEFACGGDSQVEPRVGDEFQAKIPPTMSASKRALYLSTPASLDDSSFPFLVGQPVQVMWIDKHPKQQGNRDDNDVDMSQSLKSLRAKRKRSDKYSVSKKQRLSLEPIPETPSSSWEDLEVASFVLGLYTFGKNFTQVKNFMESKGTREIVLFYYSKFYKSDKYNSWSHSRKKRNRRCVSGRKLYSGWRQQQLLSRLIPSLSDESQKQMLLNVSKSFAEGKITLEKYISAAKDLVGLKLLVEAVAIGKGKEDLTVLTPGPVKTKPWFTVSSVPGLGGAAAAYTSLTTAEIVNQLKGNSRLSKARCSDIFWEAVWPRLLARGWRSEQVKDRGYFTSKDNIVFIVPGVKQFSRGELVKGYQYFDSVSDILTKVALEPELLEFETGGEVAENSSDEESSPSDSQRHCYLKSPCSNRGTSQMNFTVVDTSLAARGNLCDLRNLNSQLRTSPGEQDSSVERVKDLSKKLIKHKSTQRAETNSYHSVNGALSLKRRRLSACIRTDKSLSREDSVFRHLPSDDTERKVCTEGDHLSLCAVQNQNSTHEEMNEDNETVDYMNLKSDQTKKTGSALIEIQKVSEIKPNELISSEQEQQNELCSVPDSDQKRTTNHPKQEQALELPSISGSTDTSPSNDLGTTQEHGSSDQQHHNNTDAPRRQSTRKRPLTTRALEALESSFLTTKRMKNTVKPRKRESSNRSAKACNRAQVLPDNGNAGLELSKKPLDQTEDSKPSFLLNEATTESKAMDRRQPVVLTEHPKLPPIVWKLSFKRS